MPLFDQVTTHRQSIRSDGYAMSVGEVVNLYRDRELVIQPEFQRLFRWPIDKQSRLIESLLLDIPLPAIFVAQRSDGVWEVVDGLQRLSTILKFMGELRNEATGATMAPSQLVGTRYLPSLEGATYAGSDTALPVQLRVQLKRARLDVRILLPESDENLKYELFDRLNSGGMATSSQEVRTALTIMRDPGLYKWLEDLRALPPVTETLALTDRQLGEQYDLALIVRHLIFTKSSQDDLRAFPDVDSFLTDRLLAMAGDPEFDREKEGDRIARVFDVIWHVGPDAFRKYDSRRNKTVGAFTVSSFEAVSLGVHTHLEEWEAIGEAAMEDTLNRCIRSLWSDSEFQRYSGAGVKASTRAPRMKSVGARIMKP